MNLPLTVLFLILTLLIIEHQGFQGIQTTAFNERQPWTVPTLNRKLAHNWSLWRQKRSSGADSWELDKSSLHNKHFLVIDEDVSRSQFTDDQTLVNKVRERLGARFFGQSRQVQHVFLITPAQKVEIEEALDKLLQDIKTDKVQGKTKTDGHGVEFTSYGNLDFGPFESAVIHRQEDVHTYKVEHLASPGKLQIAFDVQKKSPKKINPHLVTLTTSTPDLSRIPSVSVTIRKTALETAQLDWDGPKIQQHKNNVDKLQKTRQLELDTITNEILDIERKLSSNNEGLSQTDQKQLKQTKTKKNWLKGKIEEQQKSLQSSLEALKKIEHLDVYNLQGADQKLFLEATQDSETQYNKARGNLPEFLPENAIEIKIQAIEKQTKNDPSLKKELSKDKQSLEFLLKYEVIKHKLDRLDRSFFETIQDLQKRLEASVKDLSSRPQPRTPTDQTYLDLHREHLSSISDNNVHALVQTKPTKSRDSPYPEIDQAMGKLKDYKKQFDIVMKSIERLETDLNKFETSVVKNGDLTGTPEDVQKRRQLLTFLENRGNTLRLMISRNIGSFICTP